MSSSCCIGRASSTATCAHSRCDAARRSRRARSRAASMKMPATRLVRSPAQGLRAIVSRPQARRDAVRPSQAHPQARPPPAARPARGTRRVHARGHRPEPTPPWQVRRQTAAAGCCVRCVSVACVGECAAAAVPSGAHGKQQDLTPSSRPFALFQSPTSATKSASF